jgi:NitT/TauT family transport system substrate-binding protein
MTRLRRAARRAAVYALATGVLAACTATGDAQQVTKIRFQLDWRFEGPSALFLLPAAKGYFKQEGLDVTIDAGNGSAGAVNRVASGTYDMVRRHQRAHRISGIEPGQSGGAYAGCLHAL